jgi:hypothetical protein
MLTKKASLFTDNGLWCRLPASLPDQSHMKTILPCTRKSPEFTKSPSFSPRNSPVLYIAFRVRESEISKVVFLESVGKATELRTFQKEDQTRAIYY